jgi:hypothetical protein
VRRIKAADRPRDVLAGEDVVTWAVRTGRIMAASADDYRRRLNRGGITEHQLESLSPVLAGREIEDVNASGNVVAFARGNRTSNGAAYAASPIVDQIRATNPEVYRMASREASAPRLFGANHDRDLPVITASGLDPEILNQVPWQARHRIAAEADRGKVYELMEIYASDPDAAEMDFGPGSRSGMDQEPSDVAARAANEGYMSACFRWAAGSTPVMGALDAKVRAAGADTNAMSESEYRELFPEG